jgi:hypothetical protein
VRESGADGPQAHGVGATSMVRLRVIKGQMTMEVGFPIFRALRLRYNPRSN